MNHLPLADLVPGVVAGLAAAFFSAVSYLVSRHHGQIERARGRRGATLRLLTLSHVIMGCVCLPLSLVLWPAHGPALARFALPLALSVGFYLLGQAAFFTALARVEASRITPLLGLKIAMLAGIVTFVIGRPLDGHQWLAVGLSIVAAAMLQGGAGAAPGHVVGLVLASCLCFAVSDLWIVGLIDGLQAGVAAAGGRIGRLHAGGLAMTLTYTACGLVYAPVVMRLRPLTGFNWTAAAWYAAAWLGSMAGLYCCFGLVGVVLGNILQSMRGVLSVALGAIVAQRGWHDLEQRVDRATLLRRLAAAALMTAAIAIYVADLS